MVVVSLLSGDIVVSSYNMMNPLIGMLVKTLAKEFKIFARQVWNRKLLVNINFQIPEDNFNLHGSMANLYLFDT